MERNGEAQAAVVELGIFTDSGLNASVDTALQSDCIVTGNVKADDDGSIFGFATSDKLGIGNGLLDEGEGKDVGAIEDGGVEDDGKEAIRAPELAEVGGDIVFSTVVDEAAEQPVLDVEKVGRIEVVIDGAYELMDDGRDGLHNGGIESIVLPEDGVDSIERPGSNEEGIDERKDSKLVKVDCEGDTVVSTSANDGVQQTALTDEIIEKVEAVGEVQLGGVDGSSFAGEGCNLSELMDLDGDISRAAVLDNDEGLQIPELVQGGESVENRVESKETGEKPLSKSALKQLAKQARYKEVKTMRKAAEKDRRHQETARKRREWEEKLATFTEEEKEKAKVEKFNVRKERKDEQKLRKEKLRQALETGQNLVIDLEFSDLMKPNEITSLIQQVMYSYAANARAAVPCRISLTGVTGIIKKELDKIAGFPNWLVHKEERSYVDAFEERQSDLVYLTADSENILETLDSSKIYIVGGLVDRNRWKNITLEKATKQGISTAKLPFGDHLKMMASQVLTVNQVMELLLHFMEVGDWKKALTKVVPSRKRAADESAKDV